MASVSTPPNIIIFNPDQWRGEALAHLGNPAVVTPNLDRVAATDGVSFRWAFCQGTVCVPSRCSFMSGWYPHVRGHRTMYHMMHANEPVLLKTLKDNGYFVWWGGKNDLTPGQMPVSDYCDVRHKFDWAAKHKGKNLNAKPGNWRGAPDSDTYYSFYHGKIDDPEANSFFYHDWAMVNGAVDLIRNAPKDKPFCIYLPLIFPHPTYAVEDPWYSMIDRSKVPARIPTPKDWKDKPAILKGICEGQHLQGWSEERWTELRAVYYGMCARVDHQFGMVMTALREMGLYDNTAVFCFSDHGDYTGDYGLVEKNQNTYEDVITRVPFVIKPPASVGARPRVSDALVELVDFPATVEEIAGIAPRHTHFGKSLVPLLQGKTDEHRDAVFCEGGRLHGETHCMETEFPATPESLYWPRLSLQRSEGPEHGKAVMCRTKDFKYVRRLYEKEELYDLRNDPRELVNEIDNPQYLEPLLQMKERMLTFFMETGDVVPWELDKR